MRVSSALYLARAARQMRICVYVWAPAPAEHCRGLQGVWEPRQQRPNKNGVYSGNRRTMRMNQAWAISASWLLIAPSRSRSPWA